MTAEPPDDEQREPARSGTDSGLLPGDEALMVGLLAGWKVKRAAEKAGVPLRTAFSRLRRPAFKQELARRRGDILAVTVSRLAELTGRAVRKLKELLSCGDFRAELQAAKAILEQAGHWAEFAELTDRLAELERKMGGDDAADGGDDEPVTIEGK